MLRWCNVVMVRYVVDGEVVIDGVMLRWWGGEMMRW